MTADVDVDLLCVGSGAGGLATALVAADLGLEPLVVEKSDVLGGATAYSYGGLWAGASQVAKRAGFSDSLDAAATYMRFVASGFDVPANLNTYVEWAPRVLEALEGMGMRFQVVPVPDHHYPEAPGSVDGGRTFEVEPVDRGELGPWAERLVRSPYLPRGVSWTEMVSWGGIGNLRNWPPEHEDQRHRQRYAAGQGLVAQLLRELERRHVRIVPGARMQGLRQVNGKVVGATVTMDGSARAINTRAGVMLATGGYESNTALVRRLEGLPDFASMFPTSIEGDGYVAAAEIGAAISRVPINLTLMMGYMVPAGVGTEVFRPAAITEMAYPHTMVVNRDGRRFADESQFQAVGPIVHHFDEVERRYRNLPCFLLFDAEFASRYSFAGAAPGAAIPDWVARDDSLPALAGRLGIDADGLKASIEAFNRSAAVGEDPLFGRGSSRWANASAGDNAHKPNPNLGPVASPPYYGIRLRPTSQSSAGVLTNAFGQVLHVRGEPIAGLYGCGNVTAPTHFGAGYQAGFTLMGSLTFGYRAATHAASIKVGEKAR